MNEISSEWMDFRAKLLNCRSLNEFLEIEIPDLKDKNTLPEDEYNQIIDTISDIRYFLDKNKIKFSRSLLYKTYILQEKELICFLCDLNVNKVEQLRNIRVYGFVGGYLPRPENAIDYFFMEIGAKLDCKSTPLEIKSINAGQHKRRGRGSIGIRFLEDELIPEINRLLSFYGHYGKIGYIYGISAELCSDTNALARAKFYCKNGFKMINSHFYKYLI
jgi:hypothetical protein